MIDKNHFYFTNPKYMYSHVCIKRGNAWKVFEKVKNYPLGHPIAEGNTQEEAIKNASSIKGIKHYMIQVIE